jgi:hypothetical protein
MKNIKNLLKCYDVRLSSNIVKRSKYLEFSKSFGSPVMCILGKRYKDITTKGLNEDNKISSKDLIGFSKSVYNNSKDFRKFCKVYFKRANEQLSKEAPDGWLKYHLSGIKNPLAVYVELGGVIEYDCMRQSFLKTLLQSYKNFCKALWNFNKVLVRKVINTVSSAKVSH